MIQGLWQTAVHERIPSEAMSRVPAYDSLVSLGLTPRGLALVGPPAAIFGTTAALGAAVVLIGVSCLGVLGVPAVSEIRAAVPRSVLAGEA